MRLLGLPLKIERRRVAAQDRAFRPSRAAGVSMSNNNGLCCRQVGVLIVAAAWLFSMGQAARAAQSGGPSLLARAMAGPLRGVDEIVFCTRSRYDDPHWYANIGYYCDDEQHKAYAGNGQPDDGKLLKLEPPHGQGHGPAGRPGRLGPRSAGPLRRPEDPLLLPPGRHRLLPPLRDQRRRQRAAADSPPASSTITSPPTCPTATSSSFPPAAAAG